MHPQTPLTGEVYSGLLIDSVFGANYKKKSQQTLTLERKQQPAPQ